MTICKIIRTDELAERFGPVAFDMHFQVSDVADIERYAASHVEHNSDTIRAHRIEITYV